MAYDLPKTILGRTGLRVTRLGTGGAYCETVAGYRRALDCGVNYMDTARGYRDGKDEEVIGPRDVRIKLHTGGYRRIVSWMTERV